MFYFACYLINSASNHIIYSSLKSQGLEDYQGCLRLSKGKGVIVSSGSFSKHPIKVSTNKA